MEKKKRELREAGELRRKAEERLKEKPALPKKLSELETQELMQELRVHQIELEMQNEELRRTQTVVEESRAKYSDLYDFAPVGYLTLNRQGIILEANLTACSSLGKERSLLINIKNLFANFIIKKEEKDLFYQHLGKVFEAKSLETCELELKGKDNTKFYAQLESIVVKDNLSQCRTAMTDITERKRAEQILAEVAEDKFKSVFDNANDGILLADPENKKLYIGNNAICRMLGYSLEEIKKIGVMDILPEKDIPYVLKQFEDQAKGKHSLAVDIPLKRKDGSVFYTDVNGSRITIAEKTYLAGFFRDITERKRAEALLWESEKKYRSLFEGSRDANMTLEPPSWKFTTGNPAAIKMFKAKNEDEFVSCEPWKLSPKRQPDGRASDEKAKEMIEKAMREGSHFFEWTHKRIGGEEFPATVLLSRIEQDKNSFLQATVRDITELKQLENQLRENKELLQLQITRMPLACIMWDPEFRALTWNPAAEQIFGYTAAEALGKHPYDIIVPKEAQPHVDVIWRRLLEGDTTANTVNVNFTKDGRKILCDWHNTPIKKPDGTITGALSMVQDITERKRAEEEMRESEDKFKSIFNNATDGILLADLETKKFAMANNEICRMIGYSREEIETLGVMDIYPEKDIPYILDQFKRLTNGEFSLAKDMSLKRKDGNVFYADVNYSNIIIAGKTYLMGFFRDITERKLAEETLRESENKYRGLFESSRDANMTLEPPSWKFTSGNPAAIEMFKAKNEDEFVSYEPWKLSPERQPDGRASDEKAKEMIEKAVREGSHFFEWTHKRIGGEEFPATVLLSRIEQDKNSFLQATVRDITERKRTEIELEKYRDNLEQLVKDKTVEIQKSEIRFKTVFENSRDGILLADSDSKKFYMWNRTICNMLGYTDKEIKSLSVNDIHPEKDLPQIIEAFEKQARGEIKLAENLPVKRKDGSVFYADINTSLINLSGKIYIIGSFRDITERKRSEDELREKTKELEGFFNIALDLLCIADLEGNFIKVNKAWEDILGYSVAELERRKFLEFVHPEDMQATLDSIAKLGEGKCVLNFTNRYRRKDGSYKFIEWRSTPQGNLIYAAARDITERKRAEEELEKAYAGLEDKVRERTKELQGRLDELERFRKATVEREFRMKELRDEIERLKSEKNK